MLCNGYHKIHKLKALYTKYGEIFIFFVSFEDIISRDLSTYNDYIYLT